MYLLAAGYVFTDMVAVAFCRGVAVLDIPHSAAVSTLPCVRVPSAGSKARLRRS